MEGQRSFFDKPIYQVLQHAYSIVLSNIYFLLSNILLVIYSLMVMIESKAFSVFIFMILLIPTGPSITALCSVMGKLINEKECSITREYFKGYKDNYKQSLVLSSIVSVGLFISLLDYRFFIDRGNLLGVVFIAVAVYILLVSIYAFPILSKVDISKKKLISLSFYYSIKRLPMTLIKIGLIIIGFLVSSNMIIISIICLFSLICYLSMLCDNSMILEIKDSINS